jgi:hypothetical protein
MDKRLLIAVLYVGMFAAMVFFGTYLLNMSRVSIAVASPEEALSTIDGHKHSEDQFMSILNVIQYHKPQYSLSRISDILTYAYLEIQKQLPDITLYEVATEMRNLVVDVDTPDTLECFANLYIFSKKTGY